MSYMEPLPQQLLNFCLFFGFGFLDGFLLKLIEFIRRIIIEENRKAIIVQDIIYSVISTVAFFVFLLTYADGVFRFNLLFSASVGMASFLLTLGKRTEVILNKISNILRKTVSIVFLPEKKVCIFLRKHYKNALSELNIKRNENKLKNGTRNRKKVLKNKKKSV